MGFDLPVLQLTQWALHKFFPLLKVEKGIKKEVLIQAVESALLSAVKRVIDVKPNETLRVALDPDTGEIKAFKNECGWRRRTQ